MYARVLQELLGLPPSVLCSTVMRANFQQSHFVISVPHHHFSHGHSQNFSQGGAQSLPVSVLITTGIYTIWAVTVLFQSGEVHKQAMTKSVLML